MSFLQLGGRKKCYIHHTAYSYRSLLLAVGLKTIKGNIEKYFIYLIATVNLHIIKPC